MQLVLFLVPTVLVACGSSTNNYYAVASDAGSQDSASRLGPACTAYLTCCGQIAGSQPQVAAACDSAKHSIDDGLAQSASASTFEASCEAGLNAAKTAGYCSESTDGGHPSEGGNLADACDHGTCQSCGGTNGPCACTQPSDCGALLTCVSSRCTSSADVCKYDSDCGGGVCVSGRCEDACATGSCAGDDTCVKGGCEKNLTGSSCTSNAECSATTPFCVARHCTAACTNTQPCGPGDYCDQGACAPDTRVKRNCQIDTQCNTAGGEKCNQGLCKYPCTDDTLCSQIDLRIRSCGLDKVCRSYSEAHPQCTAMADCPIGKDCVGNVCR